MGGKVTGVSQMIFCALSALRESQKLRNGQAKIGRIEVRREMRAQAGRIICVRQLTEII